MTKQEAKVEKAKAPPRPTQPLPAYGISSVSQYAYDKANDQTLQEVINLAHSYFEGKMSYKTCKESVENIANKIPVAGKTDNQKEALTGMNRMTLLNEFQDRISSKIENAIKENSQWPNSLECKDFIDRLREDDFGLTAKLAKQWKLPNEMKVDTDYIIPDDLIPENDL